MSNFPDQDTWIDPTTNLEWFIGDGGSDVYCFDTRHEYLTHIQQVYGYDCRLATGAEIYTLYDYSRFNPVFREDVPWDKQNWQFWIDTPFAENPDAVAWATDSRLGTFYLATCINEKHLLALIEL